MLYFLHIPYEQYDCESGGSEIDLGTTTSSSCFNLIQMNEHNKWTLATKNCQPVRGPGVSGFLCNMRELCSCVCNSYLRWFCNLWTVIFIIINEFLAILSLKKKKDVAKISLPGGVPQHNLRSSICSTSRPRNQDPSETSSLAYLCSTCLIRFVTSV